MNRVLSSLIALLTITGLNAQHNIPVPKLIVNITVDQLRGDYLQYFSNTFGERGFKRLINEGLMYHQVDFGFPNLCESSAIATIATGAYPYYHGVVADKKYDVSMRKEVSVVSDNNYLGNYTTDRFSPLVLQCSTLGDELKTATKGTCDVYSVAPNPEAAILSVGRYADGAFWLDDYNGTWATTTFYKKDIPYYIDRFNTTEAFGVTADKSWIQSQSQYGGFPYSGTRTHFNYPFSRGDNERFIKIKQTALINEQITTLAIRFIEQARLGSRNNPDMLNITYYAGNYKYAGYTDEYNYEIQDIYYRLDKELASLLDHIDKKVGMNNVLVVVTSTGYFDSWVNSSTDFPLFGEFYPNRCTALLNMYLMATYGQGAWVQSYYNEQIYLNKKLVEDMNLDWAEVVASAAEFVSQFSGVQEVTTMGQWLYDDTGRSVDFRRGMNKRMSGDIFIELQPGWVIANDDNPTKPRFHRETGIMTPAIFLGSSIKNQHVYRPVKATEIAPTLSFVLRIRPPNGTKEKPLQEFLQKN